MPLARNVLLAALLAVAEPVAAQPATRSVDVVGTEIRVTLADGRTLGSEQLVGAILTIAGRDGRLAPVRIDSVERDPDDAEILLHEFSVQDPATGGWNNFCQPDPKGLRKAFPMRGALGDNAEYDAEAPGFSISCTSGAQAKCVRWGYRPWKPDPAGVRMIDLYRSCMRMTRADYCGNDRPYTRDGMRIDMYDNFGIQQPDPVTELTFEAAWGPQGAICLHHVRVPENGSLDDVVRACPRLAAMPQPCDETAPGALLFNKSLAQPASQTAQSLSDRPAARAATRSP